MTTINGAVGAPSPSTVDRMVQTAVVRIHASHIKSIDVAEIARLAGIDPAEAAHIFPDNDAMDEAIGSFGIMKLSDMMNGALAATPPGDGRAALKALARAYVRFSLENRELAHVVNVRLMQSDRTNSVVRRYDAGFAPLVRQLLGETDANPSRRAVIARAFIYGLTDLTVDGHFELWKQKGAGYLEDVDATIEDFVDLLMGPPAG